MFSTLSFLIAFAWIPNLLMAQNNTQMECFKSGRRGLDEGHCRKALQNIVYDTNGCLDNLSKVVFVWHETCVLNIQKPQNLQPNRKWIESAVQSITQRCKSSGGYQSFREGVIAQVYRSTSSNVYQINQPVCAKRKCNYQPNDCLIAMNRLPVGTKGTFIPASKTRFLPRSEAIYGNCTATLKTTDSSAFRISHVEANPAFKRLLHQCGSHPGEIYISGGTEGNNGDVLLSTRGSNC